MYYVYLHIRATNGVPFYVGKGSGRRAWEFSSSRRNKAWCRVAKSRGVTVEIVQDGMLESDAHLLEMWLIAKLRHDGVRLVNLTEGGEGTSGMVPWWGREIYSISESGEIKMYENSKVAATELGLSKGAPNNIRACASGKKRNAYGYVWWFKGDKPKEYVHKYQGARDALSKVVYTSLGEVFSSCTEAAGSLTKELGTKVSAGTISTCCKKGVNMYGRAWSYDARPDHPSKFGNRSKYP